MNSKLLEMAEAIRKVQSELNAQEDSPTLAHSWVEYPTEPGAWGHLDKAMAQIIAEIGTDHDPQAILDLVYDNGESIAYNIKYLDAQMEA